VAAGLLHGALKGPNDWPDCIGGAGGRSLRRSRAGRAGADRLRAPAAPLQVAEFAEAARRVEEEESIEARREEVRAWIAAWKARTSVEVMA